jgi:hypothetical protein
MAFQQSTQGWIKDAVNQKRPEGPCAAIAVCHMQGAIPKEIFTCHLDGQSTPKQLDELLRGKAESYCAELQGVQTCCLQAFYGDENQPGATRPFIITPVLTYGENGLTTEPPTTTGMRQQEMRHMEACMQIAMGAMGRAFEYMEKNVGMLMQQNQLMATHNHQLREENIDAINVVKEMTMTLVDTRHEKQMKQLEHARESEERKKWLSMAPMLINTILGRSVFPDGNADTALVETIAENLDEESVMKIAGVLKPEMMGPLMARFTGIMEKKAKTKAEQQEAQELGSGGVEYDTPVSELTQ